MKKLAIRLKNAGQFYAGELKRETAKELHIAKGLTSKKPVVSYMGWTGHNNLGDEILYEAHLALFPRLAVVPFRKSTMVALKEAASGRTPYSAGFLGGGTLINQSNSWLERIAFLQAKDLPIYCLGTGVTETTFRAKHERTSMDDWVASLKTFKFVGVRGPYSAHMLKEAGFTNFTITGDTALALASPTYKPGKANKVIGFNYGLVKENQIWGDTNSYTNRIVASVKQLIAADYEIRLLPVWDKDIASNKQLLELVDDPRCTMRLAFDSLADYQAELAQCSLFVGQKLHATIMACMDRIPSIMIEYNPKCRDFMASVDMEHCVLKTSEAAPESILDKIHYLETHRSDIQKTLDERIRHYQKLQIQAAKDIENELLTTRK